MIGISNQILGMKTLFWYENSTVAAGETEEIELNPPSGLMYKITGIAFEVIEVASSGGSGTHQISLVAGSTLAYDIPRRLLFKYVSEYTGELKIYMNGIVKTADNSQMPANSAEQLKIYDNLYVTNNENTTLVYENNSDLDNSSLRAYKAHVLVLKDLLN